MANWIKMGVEDLIERERLLLSYDRMSKEYFKVLYGDRDGVDRWNKVTAKARTNLPTSKEYWERKGFKNAEQKVIEHQKLAAAASAKNRDHRLYSIRCKEYWMNQGYDEEEAIEILGRSQTRGLPFYIEKYGSRVGRRRYQAVLKKRIQTWEKKSIEEKQEHYLKTLPSEFNPNGQEIQAIRMFIDQNNISEKCCMFGAPKDQFYQWIPNHGFRRYDLAVFESDEKKELTCIMEFHGPGHINFSDYLVEMENEVIKSEKGIPLPHLGTYGDSYKNDFIKRKHILDNYPGVRYYVFWISDLKNKDLRIKNEE